MRLVVSTMILSVSSLKARHLPKSNDPDGGEATESLPISKVRRRSQTSWSLDISEVGCSEGLHVNYAQPPETLPFSKLPLQLPHIHKQALGRCHTVPSVITSRSVGPSASYDSSRAGRSSAGSSIRRARMPSELANSQKSIHGFSMSMPT